MASAIGTYISVKDAEQVVEIKKTEKNLKSG